MNSHKKPNRLINEKSPYLMQHAFNPVDWYPWCDEAFERAKKENKPIFLSIGYSTCHWCHVMEKESFEDEEIAKLMNETFINIKVDKEERPDIDQFYMNVCMMLTGRGGWPLTIIMTPDKKPFFAGTYIPKETRYNIIGMKELIPQIKKIWEENKEIIDDRAEKILKLIKENSEDTKTTEEISQYHIKLAFKHLENSFDSLYGGFSQAPKFPSPHNILFLLRYYNVYKEKSALYMASKTLKQMRQGGIFDHIGFGFHRYSTDNRWLLPHFEKMLYDQGMLLMAYTEAYQLTKDELFKQTIDQIITYLKTDMLSPEGAFYSAEDADSEGEEGKFYTFEYNELQKILGRDFEVFKKISNIKEEGNYLEEATKQPSYRNIIHISKEWEQLSKETGLSTDTLQKIYTKCLEKLKPERNKRERPLKDTKILTDWNSIVIAALIKAGMVLQNATYIELAKNVSKFIIENLLKNDTLYHRYKDGEIAVKGNLDDYAYFIWGLIHLYQATFEEKYLKLAVNLTDKMINLFYDEENGGFFFTSVDNKDVLIRQKESYDGAYPSGNSIAYNILIYLFKITSDTKYQHLIKQTENIFAKNIKLVPGGHTMFLIGLINQIFGYEVIFAGKKQTAIEYIHELEQHYIPNKSLAYKDRYTQIISDFISNVPEEKEIKVYICKNFACQTPVNTKDEMLKLLKYQMEEN